MSEFIFDVQNGEARHDVQDLPSYKAARHAALHKLASILAQEAECDRLTRDGLTMEVSDSTGITLLRLDLSITESAAIKGD